MANESKCEIDGCWICPEHSDGQTDNKAVEGAGTKFNIGLGIPPDLVTSTITYSGKKFLVEIFTDEVYEVDKKTKS